MSTGTWLSQPPIATEVLHVDFSRRVEAFVEHHHLRPPSAAVLALISITDQCTHGPPGEVGSAVFTHWVWVIAQVHTASDVIVVDRILIRVPHGNVRAF
jgi:hypothetical protein